jgi:hypothetical protein
VMLFNESISLHYILKSASVLVDQVRGAYSESKWKRLKSEEQV